MERLTTGVPGLDRILRGGLMRGGIYMLMGRPGCGKTTLGNQICFHHAKEGGRAVYATLLTESHGRMLALLETFSFFDPTVVGESIQYVSAFNELESGGLPGLLDVLRTTVRKSGATLLVLDGVPTAEASAPSEIGLKKFIHELQIVVELLGATCLLLTGANHPDAHYAERTMVDGLIVMAMTPFDLRTVREIEVVKHRGSAQLAGRHMYKIGQDGLTVFPRVESLGAIQAPPDGSTMVSLGVLGLDGVLAGGVRSGSVTLVKGPAGSGKTLLGLSFLCADEQPGVFLGFHECPERLQEKAAGVGLRLRAARDAGRAALLWRPDAEHLADELVEQVLAELRRTDARRLVIDGLGAFMSTLVYPGRAGQFFSTLFHALRGLDVATLLTMEGRDLVNDEPPMPVSGVSALVDNILHLRLLERGPDGHRLICVSKASAQAHDRSLRELTIGASGLVVERDPVRAEALMAGLTRSSAPDVVAGPSTPPDEPRARGGAG